MIELHTSASNAEFCLYGTYVRQSTLAGVANSAGHLYCLLLLLPRALIELSEVGWLEQPEPPHFFVAKFVIIARVHSLLSGTTPH